METLCRRRTCANHGAVHLRENTLKNKLGGQRTHRREDRAWHLAKRVHRKFVDVGACQRCQRDRVRHQELEDAKALLVVEDGAGRCCGAPHVRCGIRATPLRGAATCALVAFGRPLVLLRNYREWSKIRNPWLRFYTCTISFGLQQAQY